MSGGFDLGGFSMFELFKGDAESNLNVLNAGLLALEGNPSDLGAIEPLMRAAHSIKGAARIIGLDVAVKLAHAMEDCLVAVQKGRETLVPARIDQLLKATDLLAGLAAGSEADVPAWSAANEATIEALGEALRGAPPAAAPAPAPSAAPVAVASPEPPPAAPAAPAIPAAPSIEVKTVRVTADSLDRMMRLAGEMMIESRRFRSLRNRAETLKGQLLDTGDLLEVDAAAAPAREMVGRAQRELVAHLAAIDDLARRTEEVSAALYHSVLGSRMRPFQDATVGFPRMVRDVAKGLGKQVRLEILGGTVPVDRDILAKLEAPLNHMLRNAVDHGIETPEVRTAAGKDPVARLVLEARHQSGMLVVRVADDGRGIDAERIREKVVAKGLVGREMAAGLSAAELYEFLFLPGFSTASEVTEISGRGVGLDVVLSTVQQIGGSAKIESAIGKGTTFLLRLPVTLSVVRAATVLVDGEPFAFPLARLERVVRLEPDEIAPVEGRPAFTLDGRPVGLVDARTVLGFPAAEAAAGPTSVVVIGHGRDGDRYGLVVDRFEGESDLVVRPLDPRLGKVPCIAAASLFENGDPLLIVDVDDLVASVRQLLVEGRLRGGGGKAGSGRRTRRILVVDDSLTVREVERQLLTRLGYEVDVAVDGADGWNAIRAAQYDLLVSDIDMPRMNGIELVRAVRSEPRFAALPIVIVSYKDRPEDRLAGLDAGANVYLTKGAFQDDTFAATVRDLIGGPDADREGSGA
jgi:two-component system sensor histidine kinase and response regulator WspE